MVLVIVNVNNESLLFKIHEILLCFNGELSERTLFY